MAVIAAAGKMGISRDELCAQAVGGLISDPYWSWADARYAQGAADEIDNALNALVGRPAMELALPVPGTDPTLESAPQIECVLQ
ncbi:hypothetical protein PSH84_14465 [Pseudomonas beijingensis]|jgi:hypothetical protein|uniref:hypothetical protein n=2 Tax=Pseudomonas TaxID=286 RepID=UPI00273686AC|nr:hypothetical protein [Pseudomonas sp. FP830]WLI47959.1 hypothetical protein PSH84_14465 [Pseudomonas sp. FP830]